MLKKYYENNIEKLIKEYNFPKKNIITIKF